MNFVAFPDSFETRSASSVVIVTIMGAQLISSDCIQFHSGAPRSLENEGRKDGRTERKEADNKKNPRTLLSTLPAAWEGMGTRMDVGHGKMAAWNRRLSLPYPHAGKLKCRRCTHPLATMKFIGGMIAQK